MEENDNEAFNSVRAAKRESDELLNKVTLLTQEINEMRRKHNSIQSERENEIENTKSSMLQRIRQLENEINFIKDQCSDEISRIQKNSEESIAVIKNGYEIEKEYFMTKLTAEKQKHERNMNDLRD